MWALFDRILDGYSACPFRSFLYGFLLFLASALCLAALAPYFPDSTPDQLTSEEEFEGNVLTAAVAALSFGLAGWKLGRKRQH